VALQKTIALPSGVVVADAYHRIAQAVVAVDGDVVRATVDVASFVDRDHALASAPPVVSRVYAWDGFDRDDDAQTAHAQLYAHLKTLDDFAGAADV
jgi:hypothetical protein